MMFAIKTHFQLFNIEDIQAKVKRTHKVLRKLFQEA
jgi:hypothetical protein